MDAFEKISISGYTIKVFSAFHGPRDLEDDNLDIEVIREEDGVRYLATAFTMRNIQRIMKEAERTGELAGGAFFWCKDLVIVRDLSIPTIVEVISELIRTEELHQAFQEAPPKAIISP